MTIKDLQLYIEQARSAGATDETLVVGISPDTSDTDPSPDDFLEGRPVKSLAHYDTEQDLLKLEI